MGKTINIKSKYYIRKANGGYNPCISGNTAYMKRLCAGSVVPNCVGYATGRFNERLDLNACKYLGNTNAGNFITAFPKKQGLKVSQSPVEGAVMVWKKTGGAGHVAIVEEVKSKTEIITSESGWSYKTSYYTAKKTRTKGGGNWGLGSAYKFQGFMYLPGAEPKPAPQPTPTGDKVMIELNTYKYNSKSVMHGEQVRTIQELLNAKNGAKLKVDGYYGAATEKAVKAWQKKKGLTQDGICGQKTWESLLK